MRFARCIAFCGILLSIGIALPSHTVNAAEVQVTTSTIVDPEYDQAFARFTFVDDNGSLWIGNVDPATGSFIPANGQGILVDTNAAQARDFGNGPEWMYSQLGQQIVYTRYRPGVPHSAGTAGVALAQQANGHWTGAFLPVGIRTATHTPDGTQNDSDAIPRVSFNSESGVGFYWQNSNDPSSEQPVPQSDQGDGTRRWVAGTHQIFFTAIANAYGAHQAYLYDTDTSTLTQLTNDAGDKQGGFMWRAPEFNNAMVFFTTVDRTRLQVYRQQKGSSGNWVWALIDTINMPLTLPYVGSPEPLVYNGRSYIFMQASTSSTPNPTYGSNLRYPSQIALSGIMAAHPDFRLLTSDGASRYVRVDPEVVILNNGPSIYYNKYIPSTPGTGAVSQGMWRVDTGLGPPTIKAQRVRDRRSAQ